jgi:hypothetical protein
MIAMTTEWRAKATIAFAAVLAGALVLASISGASAQSSERSTGLRNVVPSYQDGMSWAAAQPASARVHHRARRAFGSVPNGDVAPRGTFVNPDSNYWYERNRSELRGRW